MAKKQKTSSQRWFTNVAKSLGYTFSEMMEETMPTTVETIQSNKDFIINTAKTIKGLKGKKGSMESMLSGSMLNNWKNLKSGISNAKRDLKSGTFYRGAAYGIDDGFDDLGDFGDLDFDDDMSFDDNLSDDSFDDRDESQSTPSVKVISNINSDNPMVQGITTQTSTMIDIAENEAKRDLVIASENMKLLQKLGLGVHNAIGSVNENIGTLVSFATKDGASYINASLRYYEESIGHLSSISETLDKIATAVIKPTGDESSTKQKLTWHDAIGWNGVLNLENYTGLVKKQLMSALDENMFTSSIKMMLSDDDTIKNLMAQPLSFIPKTILKTVIPEFLRESLTVFDTSVKSFIPALLTRIADISNLDDGGIGIFKLIGDAFGLRSRTRSHFDTKNYERGPVPFDGITKKSIVEVIPGYLSKILSAITGKEGQLFDYDSGKFVTVSKLKKTYDQKLVDAATGSEGFESAQNIIDKVNQTKPMTNSEREAMTRDINNLFVKLSQSNAHRINPVHENFADEIAEISGATNDNAAAIAEAIRALPKSEQMNIAGMQSLKARENMTKLFDELEANGGISNFIANDFYNSEDFKSDTKTKSSIFSPSDKYGKTALDYLRDIKYLMLHGVATYKVNRNAVSGIVSAVDTFQSEEDKYKQEEERNKPKEDNTRKVLESTSTSEPESKQSIYQRIVSFIFGGTEERRNVVKEFFEKRANSVKKLLRTADDWMYRIAFGNPKDDDDEKPSFFKSLFNKITAPIKKFGSWLKEKIYDPIREFFFGKDGKGGLVDKIKNSELFKKAKGFGVNATNYLFGAKTDDGKRSGGLFSDIHNSLVDTKNSVVSYFTGKDKNGNPTGKESVFGSIKEMGTSVKNGIKSVFVGEGGENKAKGLFADIAESLRMGAKNFADIFFGVGKQAIGEKGADINTDELIKKVKERAPKGLAGGVIGLGAGVLGSAGAFGVLGSMFLSPIGGAAIGTAVGFLSQSESFKDWLFGKKDEQTNERIGGFISKSTQDFFKKNKNALVTGATLGAGAGLLGIGVLPSFILGGPVGGAITGIGAALLAKSDTFQNFLFGKMDEDTGKRVGGLINKNFTAKMSDNFKKKFGTAAVGGLGAIAISKTGILGLATVNPILAAAGGIAAGLVVSGDKFKEKLFGTDDGTGKRRGGLLENLSDKIEVNLIQPLKIKFFKSKFKLENWLDESIAEPLVRAFDPVKEEFRHAKELLKDLGSKITDKFMQSKPIKALTGLVKTVGKGILGGLNKLVKGTFSLLGKVISAPFKLLGNGTTKILQWFQKRRGLKNVTSQIWENMADKFKQSTFYKRITSIHDTLVDIKDSFKDFTKRWIKRGANFIKNGIKSIYSATVGRAGAAISTARDKWRAKRGLMSVDEETQQRLDDIKSGNRSFWQSVGDRVTIAVPWSKLRRAAKKEGMPYYDDWVAGNNERASKRSERRHMQDAFIKEMEDKNKANKEILGLGRELTDEEREKISSTEFNKIIDRNQKMIYGDLADKYGKDSVKGKSKMELAVVHNQETMSANSSKLVSIQERIANLLEKITGFIFGKRNAAYAPASGGPIESEFTDNDVQQLVQPGFNIPLLNSPRSETEMHNIEYNTMGETYQEQQDRKAKENEANSEQKKHGIFSTIADGIKSLNEKVAGHSSNWSSIFGKKGLLTLGLILFAPQLIKIVSAIANALGAGKGLFNAVADGAKAFIDNTLYDDNELGVRETRTDAGGDTQINTDNAGNLVAMTRRHLVKQKARAKAAVEAGETVVKTGKKVVNTGKKAVKTVKSGATKIAKKMGFKVADEAAEAGAKKPGIITKFISLVKQTIPKLIDFLTKKFPKAAGLASSLKNVAGKAVSQLKESVLGRFVSKITAGFSKVAAGAATLFLSDAAFVIAGAADGAVAAANIFQVPADAVDAKMRLIGAAIKAITNFSWFWVIDLLNEIVVSLTGVDFIHEIAVIIYNLLPGGDSEKLAEAQKQFDVNYNNYTKVQQLAKDNIARDEDGNIIYDENGNPVYKDENLVENKSSYNDRVNKGLWGKIGSGIKNVWDSTGGKVISGLFGQKGNEEKYNKAVQSIENLQAAAERGEIDPNSDEYKEAMKTLKKEKESNTKKKGVLTSVWDTVTFKKQRDLLFGDKEAKQNYDRAVAEIEKLKNAAESGEVDPESEDYKSMMKSLEAERDKYATKAGIKRLASTIDDKLSNSKIYSGIKTVGKAIWDTVAFTKGINGLFGKTEAKKNYDRAVAEIKKLEEAAKRGEVDPESEDYKTMMKSLEAERDKYAADAGIVARISSAWAQAKDSKNVFEAVGKFGKALWDTSGFIKMKNKLFGSKDDKDNYKRAISELEELDKAVERGEIDPNSAEYKKLRADLEAEATKYAKKSGLLNSIKSWWMNRKAKKASDKLAKLEQDADSGKISRSSSEYIKKKEKYEEELRDAEQEAYGIGGPVEDGDNSRSTRVTPQSILSQYTINSNYGTRTISGQTVTHHGIDLGKAVDSPVQSFTDGRVEYVSSGIAPNSGYYGSKAGGGFGNYVAVRDGNGKLNLYAHMNSVAVSNGQRVSIGDTLGTLGHTGSSTGPHLHYEIRDELGKKSGINPSEYLGLLPTQSTGVSSSNTSNTNVSESTNTTEEGTSTGIQDFFDTIKNGIYSFVEPLSSIFGDITKSISGLFGITEKSSTDGKMNYDGSPSSDSSGISSTDGEMNDDGSPSSDSSGISSSGINLPVGNNLIEEIALKTLELTTGNEGRYNTVVANDNGSYSVGIMGFHGGIAKEFFNRMAKSGKVDTAAANKYASWYERALSTSEANEMTEFLNKYSDVSQPIQNQYATELITNRNLKVPLEMYRSGILKDPRSMVLAADIGNTGPAHLTDWKPLYKAAKSKDEELAHVRDSLKSSDSFWGNATGSPYYGGWMNRINRTYEALKSWKPKHDNDAPVDGIHSLRALSNIQNQTNTTKGPVKLGIGGPIELTNRFKPSSSYSKLGTSYVNSSQNNNSVEKLINYFEAFLQELKAINTNTRDTSDNIDKLAETNKQTQNSNQTTNNTPVVVNASSSNNPMFEIAEKRRSNIKNNSYDIAKRIAAGGTA